MPLKIKLGSRKSPLALIQANQVKQLLQANLPEAIITIIEIMSQGDIDKTSPLSAIGGKGVFVKALEDALLTGQIDIAIHSLKDITSTMPDQLELTGFLSPESRSDTVVFNPNGPCDLAALPEGSVIATSSMRRLALLAMQYPHLKTVDIRGNVDTRLQKLVTQNFSATILSTAGLKRLNKWGDNYTELNPLSFIPAPGQGVVTMQTKKQSTFAQYCQQISCPIQTELSQLEMAILTRVGLDCRYPFGLYITKEKNIFKVRSFVASQDGLSQQLFSYAFEHTDNCIQMVCEEAIKALKQLNK